MLGNPDDAADVTQTTFLRLIGNLDHYKPQFRLFSWIYRIAVNEAIHQINRRKPREPLAEIPDIDTSEDSAVRHELHREIQVVLMELQEDHRAVIVLRYFSDCSYDEMSEILQLPEKTVKSRLYTARQQLKGRLQDRGIFPE
jgi:RNA polymerase sigma-70 factor (ECF subfamily)